MIRPYLSDIINDHETPKTLKFHRCDEVFDFETQYGEQKIQLAMSIDLFPPMVLMRTVICVQKVIVQKL